MKNYIENNLEDLKKLGNDIYQIVDIYKWLYFVNDKNKVNSFLVTIM